jgi:hypothetical protein
MITAEQIRVLMRANPFKPFRICLSDGSGYDILNHDMAMVGRNTVEVGVNPDAQGFAAYFARCSILHITKLEDLQPA